MNTLWQNNILKKASNYFIIPFICSFLLITPAPFANAYEPLPDDYYSKASSKQKFFGVNGWDFGKNCPNIELYWETKGNSTRLFFKDSSNNIIKLSGDMAIFSPNCKYFWCTQYEPKDIEVFSTLTGKRIIKIVGEYPAWSSDGKSIYFFRTKNTKRQLWELNVEDQIENVIIEAKDYGPCFPADDEPPWYPVTISKEGYILWEYALKDCGQWPPSGKKLTIDPQKKKIIKTERKKMVCY